MYFLAKTLRFEDLKQIAVIAAKSNCLKVFGGPVGIRARAHILWRWSGSEMPSCKFLLPALCSPGSIWVLGIALEVRCSKERNLPSYLVMPWHRI